MTPNDDRFLDALRDGLNHLYDPDKLRNSPLVSMLGLPAASPQTASKLQQVLLDAIQSMRPASGEPPASIRRRIYSVLQLRYEQQFTQKEVAAQLALGVRQYRRLQQTALQSLALRLSEQFELEASVMASTLYSSRQVNDLPETLQWIAKLDRDETAQADQVLKDALRLVTPLAQQQGKRLCLDSSDASVASIHPLALRQALLTVLNAAILHSTEDEIVCQVNADRRTIFVRINGRPNPQSGISARSSSIDELSMVESMLRYFGGDIRYAMSTAHGGFSAELRCPSAMTASVLVVDDHEDTVDLLQRYVEGTPYALIAIRNPQQAFDLAVAHQPQAILLDVMMPEMDGWEVLTQLKQDARTTHIPVLVCTVLDQSELALSLGASGFLRKPVTRSALLAVLDAHAAQPAPISQ